MCLKVATKPTHCLSKLHGAYVIYFYFLGFVLETNEIGIVHYQKPYKATWIPKNE